MVCYFILFQANSVLKIKQVYQKNKYYSEEELRIHQSLGDIADDGTLIFKHPFCLFCRESYYDEDKLKKHLNLIHYNCSLCENRKLTYYKDESRYKIHLKLSHYFCSYPECEKQYYVFKTSGELDLHKQLKHCADLIGKKQQINIQQFTGFYEEENSKNILNDKEGKDFTSEFLWLQKNSLRITNPPDCQQDEVIDFRNFYYTSYHDDQNRKSEKRAQSHSLKDITLWKPSSIPSLPYQIFSLQCQQYFSDINEYYRLISLIRSFENETCELDIFVESFMKLFDLQGGIKFFQLYLSLREVKQQKQTWSELDKQFCIYLRKTFKGKNNNNLILTCPKYSALFYQFQKQLDLALEIRIQNRLITALKETKLARDRIYQFNEVLRCVTTQELSKLKFASNFGVSLQVIELVRRKVFLDSATKVQEYLQTIPNNEFIPLYLYINIFTKLITGLKIHQKSDEINECVCQEFFDGNPSLLSKLKSEPNPKQSDATSFPQMCPQDFPLLPKSEIKIYYQKQDGKTQLGAKKLPTKVAQIGGFEMDDSFVPVGGTKAQEAPQYKQSQQTVLESMQISKKSQKGKTVISITGGFC